MSENEETQKFQTQEEIRKDHQFETLTKEQNAILGDIMIRVSLYKAQNLIDIESDSNPKVNDDSITFRLYIESHGFQKILWINKIISGLDNLNNYHKVSLAPDGTFIIYISKKKDHQYEFIEKKFDIKKAFGLKKIHKKFKPQFKKLKCDKKIAHYTIFEILKFF